MSNSAKRLDRSTGFVIILCVVIAIYCGLSIVNQIINNKCFFPFNFIQKAAISFAEGDFQTDEDKKVYEFTVIIPEENDFAADASYNG